MSESRRCPQCGAELPAGAPDAPCPACLIKLGLESWADRAGDGPGQDAEATETMLGRFQPPDPKELTGHFPQLEILELLGVGGMGAVYKARQPGLDRLVALKILPPEVGRDPAFAERFAREARAMARLSHPNIVAIHDSGQAAEFYYFVMEFVEGVNLRQTFDTGELTPQEVLAIVPQICEALQYAHDEGIIHRDIKPENILLDKRGRVKIADFGLAKLVGREAKDFMLTGIGQVMGTPQYMAPEQIEHPQQVDRRADIYSLGVVFYQMLTGELPIGRFDPPSRKVQIDVRLDEVVLRALEKEPDRRYQQVSELRTQVETITNTPISGHNKEAESERAPTRILKADYSTATTPERLATATGQLTLYQSRGQLTLDQRQLTFSRAGMNTVIPLAAIRDLSIGRYPRVVNPWGLRLISVTYDDGGQTKRLFFSPMLGWICLPWDFNRLVTDWFHAIRDATTVAQGRVPASTPAEQLGVPSSSLGIIAMLIIPELLLGGALLGALLMGSSPGNAADNGPLVWLPTLTSIGMILFALLGFLFFILAFVRSKTGRARVSMVGVRNGKRVIHWPGVALCAAVIPMALGMVACLAYFVGGPRAIEFLIRLRSLGLLPIVSCTLLPIFIGLGIKCRLDWAKPIEELPRPDASPPDKPSGITSSTSAHGKPSGSHVAWLMVAFAVLMGAFSYLSNYYQQRSVDLLQWENSLLQRQIGQGELAIEQRLRSLGLNWDNYSVELAPDDSRSSWHFVGLRKLTGVNGTNVWTRIDGDLHVEVLRNGDWQVRGDGQLGHVQFTVASPGKSTGILPVTSTEPTRLPATKSR